MNDVVYVTSMANAVVGFSIPEKHYSKSWPKKGAKLPIERDVLREAIYQPGVEHLFRQGILYIDDMDLKVELGLEEEGATKETAAILPLDDKLAMRIIKLMPISEARATLDKLSADQKLELVNFAISHHNDLDMARIQMIDTACGVKLLKSIELRQSAEE